MSNKESLDMQNALGLQKLYLKEQPRFKGRGDVIG